jgi:NADH:ubiquinone oxidoreductase subunit 3 (subunit A)
LYVLEGGPFWFAVFFLLLVAGGILFYLLAFRLAPRKQTTLKQETFESGQIPPGGKRARLVMQYFSFLLLFLIFDVVAMFMFAWGFAFFSYGWQQGVYFLLLLLFLLPSIFLTLRVAKNVGV